jgi:hypothetical protein
VKNVIVRRIDMLKEIWNKEQMPPDWSVGFLCPVYKKGDRRECENYRGITLLSCMYKVMSSIIYSRLMDYTENIIEDNQNGFRPNRGMVDSVHIMRQIIEKTYEYNIQANILIVDFKQAFDSIYRSKMLKILKK